MRTRERRISQSHAGSEAARQFLLALVAANAHERSDALCRLESGKLALHRAWTDRDLAVDALAKVKPAITLDDAIRDTRRLILSWWDTGVLKLMPHLLTQADGRLSAREVRAILSAEDGR